METDREIATVLRLPHRQHFVGGRRLGVAEEGRAEQLQAAPGERLEQPLRRIELEQGLRFADGCEIGVRVGVASHFMPVGNHPFEQPAFP